MVQEQIVSSEKTNKYGEIHQDEPQLRFKEFSEPFKEVLLGDISSNGMYGMNCAAKEFDGENKYIRITDIDENSHNFVPNPLSSPDGVLEDKFLLKENDIVFARTGASTGKSYLYEKNDGKLYFAGFLIKLEITKAHAPFVYYNTLRENYNNWVSIMSVRSGQPGINLEEYKKFKINLPSLEEQKKVANFLSAVDKKIELLDKKYQNKIIFKEEFFNNYISNMYDTEQKIKLDKLITISNERNKNDEDIQVLSISNKLGFISQEEQFEDRIVASSDTNNYKIVKKGYFAYNPARINVGSIARLKGYEKGIISPMYIVFKIDENLLNPTFFENYLSTNYFKLEILKRLEGSVRLILSADSLKNIEIYVPPLDEQNEISAFLNNLSKNINLTKKELDNFKEFKKGLLQKMFV